jgi:hypothetical protein
MNRMESPALSQASWPRVSWIAGLLALTIGYRVAAADSTDLMNTSPLMAACFGGGLLLGWRFCWVPALLLVLSDVFLGLAHGIGVGGYTLASGVIYTVAALAGALVGERVRAGAGARWLSMLAGTLLSSVVFYLVANSYVWLVSPLYEKSLAGWWQSQTVGLPQFQPQAWVFLVRSLIGDSLWCLLATPLFFWAPIRGAIGEPVATAAA